MKRLKRLLKEAEEIMIDAQKRARQVRGERLCDQKTRQAIRKYLGLEEKRN